MLLEKLEQESRASRRRRLIVAGGFAGAAVLLGLFLVAVVVVWPKVEGTAVTAEPVREDGSPVRVDARAPDDNVTRLSANPSPGTARDSEISGEISQGNPVSPQQFDDDTASRDQFKALFETFQKDIEPDISSTAFAGWDAATQQDVIAQKESAFAQFSRGQYSEALEGLEAATSQAQKSLDARDLAFDAALREARSAYDTDNYDQALPQITRARQLKPDSAEAEALEAEVARLPEILNAISKASVARVENDLEAEEKYLGEALALDADRSELALRRQEIQIERKERAYAGRVQSGLANVQSRRLSSARADLSAAREMFSDRSETRLLSRQVAALAEKMEFEKMMASAADARRADDWIAAEDFYARAGAIVPDDPQVNGGYQLAGEINQLQTEMAKVLDKPERLASESVAAHASALVSKARDIADLSPSLATRSEEVAELVKAYGTKVSIRILSDGITRISVRGVGQVGATTDRTIELRPGSYTFEGARAGFRSKLVQVDIPPGTEGLVLEIYPDERV